MNEQAVSDALVNEAIERLNQLKRLSLAIKKQQKAIRKAGFEPTWELFSMTLGWYQIKKKLNSQRAEELYQRLWERHLREIGEENQKDGRRDRYTQGT